jgi:uncharacterized membrane protein YdfJ with MMPL/SSD domain
MAVAATVLLVAAGIPFAGVQFTAVDAWVLPASASARQVDHALRTDFPPHRDTPVTLAVHGAEEAQRITAAAADPPGAAAVRPPRPLAGDVYAVDVISTAPPTSDTSQDLVRALRALDGDALVTGATARYLDLQASLGAQLALMVAIVAPSRSPCCSP